MMSNIETNKKLAKDFFTYLGSFDSENLMKLLDPSIIFNVPNQGCLGGQLTLAELPGIAAHLSSACPDGIRFEVLDLTAEDDRVSARVNGYAKLPSGEEYNNQYHFQFNCKDGKICRTYEYMDSLLVEKVFAERLKGQLPG